MHGEYKEPGQKLVAVDLEVVDGRLSNVNLSGDFFLEPDDALFRFNRALIGVSEQATVPQLVEVLNRAMHPQDVLFGLSLEGIAIAVRRALGKAVAWEDIDFDVMRGPVVHPVMNMALDEVLAGEVAAGRRKPHMRIWEWDRPLLVMGSFQSYMNEVNPEGVLKHGVTVSRRITGGGTMFMEPGNCVTYSLCVPVGLVEGLSFEQSYSFLDQWCMGALKKCGVDATYVPLNDIASAQGKIGGAAQKRFANGVMVHHVTMAYDIDTIKMMECMRIGAEKLRDKGVRSAVKRVDPMRSQTGLERDAIIEIFIDHFLGLYPSGLSEITDDELVKAEDLMHSKFLSEEWIHRVP
ncbi:MAG: biotin/lipoate A/B protein ligase family protein [Actinomycetaceae bacterium]|nr:biotin/lipoate A/B protein ligase family protein [Actinomycetaceae bacterium]